MLLETSDPLAEGSMSGYAGLLAEALAAHAPEVEVVRLNVSAGARWLQRLPGTVRNAAEILLMRAKTARQTRVVNADALHLVDGSRAHLIHSVNRSLPTVVTAHDVIPLLQARGRFPVAPPGRAARAMIDRSVRGLRHASAIAADSGNTKDDLVTEGGLDPGRIRVVMPALRQEFRGGAGRDACDASMGQRRRYILHVGHNAFYKNREGVIRILAKVRAVSDVELVMVGPRPTSGLVRLAEILGVGNAVEFVVDPPTPRLIALYRSAALLLFPSLYEGFGWPPLEAMACGCPVVCSTAGSLPEVVGDAALTAPADDEELLAAHCLRLLSDPAVRGELVAKGLRHVAGFTSERMARGMAEVYRMALSGE